MSREETSWTMSPLCTGRQSCKSAGVAGVRDALYKEFQALRFLTPYMKRLGKRATLYRFRSVLSNSDLSPALELGKRQSNGFLSQCFSIHRDRAHLSTFVLAKVVESE